MKKKEKIEKMKNMKKGEKKRGEKKERTNKKKKQEIENEKKENKKDHPKKKERRKKKATTPQRPSTSAYTHQATPTRKTETFMSYSETFTNQELLVIVRQQLRRALLVYSHPIGHGNLHLLSRDKK